MRTSCPKIVCFFVSQHIHTCQYLMMVVLVFEGSVMSLEPIPVWSRDTAIALEDRTMRIKVSSNRLGGFRWKAKDWRIENEYFDYSCSNR